MVQNSRSQATIMEEKSASSVLKINDYYEPDHFRSICEDNYNVSRTCDYEKNEMHHIHNTCEILFVEEGEADYYISGKKYHIEPYDILVIGAMEHHLRRIAHLPFLRYGLTVKPTYFRSIILDDDLLKVFQTPDPEYFALNCKNIAPDLFNSLISMIGYLKEEEEIYKPFRSQIQRTIIIQITVILFRLFRLKKNEKHENESRAIMMEIKEYIDSHFGEKLDLNTLSSIFFLHPSTISKNFSHYCGYNLNKYINMVRICEAAYMLENYGDSVAAVSEKCGYDSINTFLRQFKSIMEISPLQYRKSTHEWWEKSAKSRMK